MYEFHYFAYNFGKNPPEVFKLCQNMCITCTLQYILDPSEFQPNPRLCSLTMLIGPADPLLKMLYFSKEWLG